MRQDDSYLRNVFTVIGLRAVLRLYKSKKLYKRVNGESWIKLRNNATDRCFIT